MRKQFDIKPIAPGATTAALAKAQQYRVLNEPVESESICLDILQADPDNHKAKETLLLALTDQFDTSLMEIFQRAYDLLPTFEDEYSKLYYEGIICERRGKAHLKSGGPGWGAITCEWLTRAMDLFEQAQKIQPADTDNDEAILRWNSCARLMMRYREIRPASDDRTEQMLE